MITRRLLLAPVVFFSVALSLAHAQPSDSDAQALRQANDSFYAALNSLFVGEVQPMTEVWSHGEDVTYLGPDGSFLVGWEATLADWRNQAARKLGGKIEAKDLHVTMGRELAIVQNYEVGNNVIDGEPAEVRIRATSLYRKEDGAWKMIGHHTDRLPYLDNE